MLPPEDPDGPPPPLLPDDEPLCPLPLLLPPPNRLNADEELLEESSSEVLPLDDPSLVPLLDKLPDELLFEELLPDEPLLELPELEELSDEGDEELTVTVSPTLTFTAVIALLLLPSPIIVGQIGDVSLGILSFIAILRHRRRIAP